MIEVETERNRKREKRTRGNLRWRGDLGFCNRWKGCISLCNLTILGIFQLLQSLIFASTARLVAPPYFLLSQLTLHNYNSVLPLILHVHLKKMESTVVTTKRRLLISPEKEKKKRKEMPILFGLQEVNG